MDLAAANTPRLRGGGACRALTGRHVRIAASCTAGESAWRNGLPAAVSE